MIITQDFTTSIAVDDTTIIYSADITNAIRGLLQQMYAGKCFKRCRIIDVTEIVQLGEMVSDPNRNGGDMCVCVKFRVRAVVYDRYEIIPDAQIVEILEDGRMLLKNADASIMITRDPRLARYEKGQTVPVCVNAVRYLPMQSTIVVQGIPFVPIRAPTTEWDVDITDDNKLAVVARLEEASIKRPAAAWASLLDPPKEPTMPGFRLVKVDSISGPGTVARPDWMPVGDTRIFWRSGRHEHKVDDGANVLLGYIHQMRKLSESATRLTELYDPKESTAWMQVYRDAAKK